MFHQWHIRQRLVCHFFVLTTFWLHLWSNTEQTHGNMESIFWIDIDELPGQSHSVCLFVLAFSPASIKLSASETAYRPYMPQTIEIFIARCTYSKGHHFVHNYACN